MAMSCVRVCLLLCVAALVLVLAAGASKFALYVQNRRRDPAHDLHWYGLKLSTLLVMSAVLIALLGALVGMAACQAGSATATCTPRI